MICLVCETAPRGRIASAVPVQVQRRFRVHTAYWGVKNVVPGCVGTFSQTQTIATDVRYNVRLAIFVAMVYAHREPQIPTAHPAERLAVVVPQTAVPPAVCFTWHHSPFCHIACSGLTLCVNVG